MLPATATQSYFPASPNPRVSYLEAVYKKVPLNLRVTRDIREGLEDLAKLWKFIARQNGQDAEEIDLTYVVARLLRVGLDGAWAEVGGRPRTPEEWKAVFAAIAERASKK